MLKNILPIGSVASYICPLSDNLIPRAARSSPIARASGNRAGEPVEFRHHEGVVGSNSRERLVRPRAGPVCAGESVVEVDAVLGDAEFTQPLPLRGEVLLVGRASRVPDERAYGGGHDRSVT